MILGDMGMRSMWSGAISFGLINIPVKLYSATEEHSITFDMLHRRDLSPIRFARICKAEEKEVPYSEIVKGYEYQKDEYVVIKEEIFKQIEQKSGAIEILHFADSCEIDSIYFEKPYFLEPGKGAEKAYALLRETLRQSDKVGVVKFVFRNKEHLGILRTYMNVIVLDQIRYAGEIRPFNELKLPKEGQINKKEIEMALKLVHQQTEKFKPEAHRDEYTQKLKEAIEAEIQGKPISKKGASAARPSKVHDIMSLLKKSLEKEKSPTKRVKKRTKKAM